MITRHRIDERPSQGHYIVLNSLWKNRLHSTSNLAAVEDYCYLVIGLGLS